MNITKDMLSQWERFEENHDFLIEDMLHWYFGGQEFNRWDWVDVCNEALSVYNEMFGAEAEKDSPIDALLSAVAAQASNGMAQAFAAMLGVDTERLQSAVSYWLEDQDNPPPAIALDELQELLDACGPEGDAAKYESGVLGRIMEHRK